MALDTRIALGIQPVQQQPNMLAQYAQIMGIKAAQQEMQGNDAVRAAYAGGGDLSDPEFRRKIMAANPQLGSKLVNQFSEMSARDVKTQADSLKVIKDNAGMARSPAEMAEYLKGAYSTPGGALLAKLVPLDKAIAAIPNDPKAFTEFQRNFSLTADKLFTSADAELRAKVDREGHGVQMRGQNLTAQTAANRLDFDTRRRTVIPGDNQYYTTGAFGDIQPVTGYGTSAPVMPPAAANAFVTSRPSVNAFAPNAQPQLGQTGAPTAPSVVQPGLPTRANAAAIDAQMNIPRPRQPFTAPVPVIDKSGNTVLMQGREAVATGATPATPATEARASAIRKLPDAIAQSRDALNLIDRMVGTADGKTKPHEGFKGAVGVGMGLRFVSGTSEADFQAMFEQIGGGAFLQAFNTLKGGGQITEKEGEKGTAAINRMKLATSEKEFINASRDFQAVLRRGIETAQKELKSGPSGSGGGAPADPLGIR